MSKLMPQDDDLVALAEAAVRADVRRRMSREALLARLGQRDQRFIEAFPLVYAIKATRADAGSPDGTDRTQSG